MLRNCRECGNVYAGTGDRCPACRQRYEEAFAQVSRFLRANPDATIDRVAEETGVKHALILEFLREGRLLRRPRGVVLQCRVCGARIEQGSLCEACAAKMQGVARRNEGAPPAGRQDRAQPPQSGKQAKMYIADRYAPHLRRRIDGQG